MWVVSVVYIPTLCYANSMSTYKSICVVLLSLLGLIAALGVFNLRYEQHYAALHIEEWPTFMSQQYHLSFQYPPGWTVISESSGIIRITPPDSDSILPILQGDGESLIFGIRIAPFETYPALPTALRETDLTTHLTRINSYSLKTLTLTMSTSTIATVVYDIEHQTPLVVIYKWVNGQLFQVELGRHFGMSTPSDVVGLFGVATTLQSF